MREPTIRFRLDFADAVSIGPGKVDLLENIRKTGSLSQAGRNLGMSYRRAWMLLDSLNSSFREPVVATSVGGKAGGGAMLTEFGAALVDTYRKLESEFTSLAAKRFANVRGAISARKDATITRTPLVRSAAPRRVKAKSASKRK